MTEKITVNGIKEDGERGGLELDIAGKGIPVGSPAYTYVEYAGGGYTYWCEAVPASALSDEVWHVIRKTDADGTLINAGTGLFEHAATDLATVAALTYTLGA